MKKTTAKWFIKGLIVLIILTILLLAYLIAKSQSDWRYFAGLENDFRTSKTSSSTPVIGNIGGTFVSIPRHVAVLPEYVGDPTFMQKRKGEVPARTFDSVIIGFGFEVRFPDMAENVGDAAKDKLQTSIFESTWIRVLIKGGRNYRDFEENLLVNLKRNIPNISKQLGENYYYEQLPELRYGLNAVIPVGFLPENTPGENGKYSISIYDNYYFHIKDNRIDAFIRCGNNRFESVPCDHNFELSPDMRAHVSMSYRKGLLPHWQEIQEAVRKKVLSFRVEKNSFKME